MNHWNQIRALGRMVAPTAVQTIFAFLPLIIYIGFAQGAEVLSMLAEAFWSKDGVSLRPALFFLLANGLAGFAIWWSARLMMDFNFDGAQEPEGWARTIGNGLQRYWPRFLGAVPVTIVAGAFFMRITKYDDPADKRLLWSLGILGGLHGILAVLLVIFFWQRRQWLKKRQKSEAREHFKSFRTMGNASVASRWTNLGLLALSLLILVALWISPIVVARYLGTGAMLSLGAVALVTIGTLLMNFRARTGVPVGTLLVLWLLFCSWAMDNHDVRLSSGNHPVAAGMTVEDAFETWREQTEQLSAGALPKLRPVFIVATEGGGIRAAYWTAQVLAALQEASLQPRNQLGAAEPKPPDFASHLFAISGVSGGSVAAAVFNALLVDQRQHPTNRQAQLSKDAHIILGQDHLAPLLGALLFPDAMQRFWPWALPGTDRGAALEKSWERAYRQVTGSNRLAEPFRSLWETSERTPRRHLPHLFLNSTMVGTGQRVIFSDLAIHPGPPGGEFLDAVDARTVLFEKVEGKPQPRDVPLSTAAHASARFTYTNPAGRVSSKQRIVDGGYFENSGTVTAMEIVQVIERIAEAGNDVESRIVPVVVIISNEPVSLPGGDRKVFESVEQQQVKEDLKTGAPYKGPPTVSDAKKAPPELKATKPLEFASELLSPPHALMGTRAARGTLAQRVIYEHQMRALQKLESAGMKTPPTFIQFHLTDWGIPLPLGWSLSKGAAGDMQAQLYERREEDRTNPDATEAILQWLAEAGGK